VIIESYAELSATFVGLNVSFKNVSFVGLNVFGIMSGLLLCSLASENVFGNVIYNYVFGGIAFYF